MKATINAIVDFNCKTVKPSFDGEALYELVTENDEVLERWYCSNRVYAEQDLVRNLSLVLLKEKGVNEIYSNGKLIYKIEWF